LDSIQDRLRDPRLLVPVGVLAVVGLSLWWVLRPSSGSPVSEPVIPLTAGAEDGDVELADEPDGASTSSVTDASPAVDAASNEGDQSGGASADVATGSGVSEISGEGSAIVVHLTGAVARPGVYDLEPDSRIADALTVAGGPTRAADLTRINLAALAVDGTRIYVPALGEDEVPMVVTAVGAPSIVDANATAVVAEDLNSASTVELQELSGVGPAIAEAIITTRDALGGFPSAEALLEVPGIGEAKLAQIRPQLRDLE